jgi:hypothetical protein
VTSILKTQEELDKDFDRILRGEEPTTESENTVKDVPDNFKQWVNDHAKSIQAKKPDKLPYYLRDNSKYVDATTSLLNIVTVGNDTYVIKDLLNECSKVETANGAVHVHPNHGKTEYTENLNMAQWRANDFGEEVILLPNPSSGKSADSYNITRKVMEEFKANTKGSINSIDRAIRDGAKQADHLIIEIRSDIKVGEFTDAVTDRLNRCESLKELRVKIGDCEAVYTREEILRDGFKIKPEDFHIGQSLRSRGVQLSPNTIAKIDNFFGKAHKKSK